MFFPASSFAILWNTYHCLLAPIGGHAGYFPACLFAPAPSVLSFGCECECWLAGSLPVLAASRFRGCSIHCVLIAGARVAAMPWYRYEIHFSQGQFHYLHHRFFECNYGSVSLPIDKWLGTFTDKLPAPKASAALANAAKAAFADVVDPKASLLGLPSADAAAYHALVLACWAVFPAAHARSQWLPVGLSPALVAVIVVVVPLLVPFGLMWMATSARSRQRQGGMRMLISPFHKHSSVVVALHMLVAAALVVAPPFWLVWAACAERPPTTPRLAPE